MLCAILLSLVKIINYLESILSIVMQMNLLYYFEQNFEKVNK